MVEAPMLHNNDFFIHYGMIVSECFEEGMTIDDPIVLFPSQIVGVEHVFQDHTTARKQDLHDFVDPSRQRLFADKIKKIRATLIEETKNKSTGSRAIGPTTQKLHQFRNGLAQGSEAMLEENPFFELTALVYQISMAAMREAFAAEQEGMEADMPRPIKTSRSLRHIWKGSGAMVPLRQRVVETLGKIASIGKVGFGMILFAGSTMTTAKGVTDLVQWPGFIRLFGDGLAGSEQEMVRFVLAILIGILLSSVILDYKSRLFQGIAETGQVFKGGWSAFKLYPRWMSIAALLAIVSIWTNYDGIVLMMSKTQDLSYQWENIEKQVENALGNSSDLDPDHPDSLQDLRAALEKKSASAIAIFQQIPEDERSGAASSGVASEGPRYWAKQYIIHGGFALGSQDVSHAYRASSFTKTVDDILARSALDLRRPMKEQFNEIVLAYGEQLDQTRHDIQADMAALGQQMTLKHYSLDELIRLFNMEAYHVNDKVTKVVAKLVENTEAFSEAAKKLEQLSERYIALLTKIDKLGIPANNRYEINITIDIPKVEAIDKLNQERMPEAKRRGLAELKTLLLERHGSLLGGAFLFAILFVAIFMDMSDPILYSAMVARWGRRDKHFLDEHVSRFAEWEKKYVTSLRAFFVKPEIQTLMPKLDCPGNLLFRYQYNLFLEEMNPQVKDRSTRNISQQFRFWFQDLFLNTRMQWVGEYNTRHRTARKFILDRNIFAPRLIDHVFPGMTPNFIPGRDHFDRLSHGLVQKLGTSKKNFIDQLHHMKSSAQRPLTEADRGPHGILHHAVEDHRDEKKTPSTWKKIGFLLFQKAFADPVPSSDLTHQRWMASIARSQLQTSADILLLTSYTALLKEWLAVTPFPAIHTDILDPLEKLLAQIPNDTVLDSTLQISATKSAFYTLESALTEVLGLSVFRGIPIKKEVLVQTISSSGIEAVSNLFLGRETESTPLERHIDQLKCRLDRIYQAVRILDEEQNTIVYRLTRIRRDLLSPSHAILSHLHHREIFEESLGLTEFSAKIATCEQFMMQLWDPSATFEQSESHTDDDLNKKNLAVRIKDNPLLFCFFCDKEQASFTLLDGIHQLETQLESMHTKLNASIFTLTFIDKMAEKIFTHLDQAEETVQKILIIEQQGHALSQHEQEPDGKKRVFMENNRLLFRSVPTQLKTMRNKAATLLKSPSIAEPHHADLLRQLSHQIENLKLFLDNALAFLQGERDDTGLSANLAQILPKSTPSPLDWTPDASNTWSLEHPPSVQEVKKLCTETRQRLEAISLQEWDLLKLAIPPQDQIRILKANKPLIDQAWLDIEGIELALEPWQADQPDTNQEAKRATVFSLYGRGEALLKRLKDIQEKITQSPIVDRRLERPEGLERPKSKEQQNERRHYQQSLTKPCQSSPVTSRRSRERVRLAGSLTLETVINGTVVPGTIFDISPTGVCIKAEQRQTRMEPHAPALIKFVSKDGETTTFNGRVVRVAGEMIILALDADQEELFSAAVRRSILHEANA